VQTYFTAWSEIGSEPEKWNPQTRETADHSLPYLLAVALTDGFITPESFSDERIRDAATRALMGKIRVSENKAFTAEFPSKLVTRIEVTTRDGERFVETASYPKGHARNPMTDQDVEAKFIGLARGLLSADRSRTIIGSLWKLEDAADVSSVLSQVRVTSRGV
jgi:2-methylcitrate dehydratase